MRIKCLDILRAIAMLMVLVSHTPSDIVNLGFFQPVVVFLERHGWTGVDLFFVLSGYLVSGLLFREYQQTGTIRSGRFLVRRGFKIYPSYYAVILLTMLVLAFQLKQLSPFNLDLILSDALFIDNYRPGYWGHLWSLAIEEHFYLILCATVVLLIRLRPEDSFRSFPPLVMALAIALLGLRVFLAFYGCEGNLNLLRSTPTHLRIDSLFFGSLLSYWHNFFPKEFEATIDRHYRLIGFASAALLLCTFQFGYWHVFTRTGGFTFLYLGYAGVMCLFLRAPAVSSRFMRPVEDFAAYLGRHSYSIYLWHYLVVSWGPPFLKKVHLAPSSDVGKFALFVSSSLVVGVVLSKLIETHFLALRDRLMSRPEKMRSPRQRMAIAGGRITELDRAQRGSVNAALPPLMAESRWLAD